MKHVFVDTNVFIDFLADRQPFSDHAAKLFNYSKTKKIKIYISTLSFNNIYYILNQHISHSKVLVILDELYHLTDSIGVSSEIIQESLRSQFKDFEDAIQYNCAKSINKIDCIVTRNTKDFKISLIPILTPKEALAMIES